MKAIVIYFTVFCVVAGAGKDKDKRGKHRRGSNRHDEEERPLRDEDIQRSVDLLTQSFHGHGITDDQHGHHGGHHSGHHGTTYDHAESSHNAADQENVRITVEEYVDVAIEGFNDMDVYQNGIIDSKELQTGMNIIGGTGLNLVQYLQFHFYTGSDSGLRNIFTVWTGDRHGLMTADQLLAALGYREEMTKQKASALVQEHAGGKSGIDCDEFIELVKRILKVKLDELKRNH